MILDMTELYQGSFIAQLGYSIKEIKKCDEITMILLDIPRGVNEYNNIYGVSENGEVIWRVQSPIEAFNITAETQGYKYFEKSIYVGMITDESGELEIVTFSGMKYVLDCLTGVLIEQKKSRW